MPTRTDHGGHGTPYEDNLHPISRPWTSLPSQPVIEGAAAPASEFSFSLEADDVMGAYSNAFCTAEGKEPTMPT